MMQAEVSPYRPFGKYSADADAGESVPVFVGDPWTGTPLRLTGRHAMMLREKMRGSPGDVEACMDGMIAEYPGILKRWSVNRECKP